VHIVSAASLKSNFFRSLLRNDMSRASPYRPYMYCSKPCCHVHVDSCAKVMLRTSLCHTGVRLSSDSNRETRKEVDSRSVDHKPGQMVQMRVRNQIRSNTLSNDMQSVGSCTFVRKRQTGERATFQYRNSLLRLPYFWCFEII
jgi:hypothetical protein